MTSASKYQHTIYFMSLLKVALCINRPKQRLLCMDTRRGCRSKRSPTPGRTKKFFSLYGGSFCYFFSVGRALCYVFLLMRGFFHRYFFFTWGAFLLRLPPGVGPFSQCGGLFCYFFLHVVGLFCLHGGFHVFMFFFMGLPLPL